MRLPLIYPQPGAIGPATAGEIARSFLVGARFDLATAAYLLSPMASDEADPDAAIRWSRPPVRAICRPCSSAIDPPAIWCWFFRSSIAAQRAGVSLPRSPKDRRRHGVVHAPGRTVCAGDSV